MIDVTNVSDFTTFRTAVIERIATLIGMIEAADKDTALGGFLLDNKSGWDRIADRLDDMAVGKAPLSTYEDFRNELAQAMYACADDLEKAPLLLAYGEAYCFMGGEKSWKNMETLG